MASAAEKTIAIDRVTPDPANLRKHSEASLEAVRRSLARFGQQKPIVVDRNMVVLAGHGVLEAARSLGWKNIRITVSTLSGPERIAYGIADNRTAELSTWDEEALRAVLGAMDEDLRDVTGFCGVDLEQLMAGGGDSGTVQDEIPAPPAAATTRPGDLWLLGDQRLLCGDCTNPDDVKRVMNGRRAVLFATDPPYLVGYDGTNHPQSFKGGGNKDWSETYGRTWDDADGNSDLYHRFIQTAVAEAIAQEAAWYCWHASRRQAMLEEAWIKAGAFVHCQIIWTKNRPVLTRTWYLWQHEPCLFGWVKKPKRVERQCVSTVWALDTIPNGEERPDHPTPKPIEIFAIPMRQHTAPGDVCYEPFSGSGTQIIAAEQLGRRCYALEIEPRYVDVTIERWQTLTGRAARLEGTDVTFDQARSSRCPSARHPGAGSQVAASSSGAAPTARPTPPRTSAKPGPASQPHQPVAATAPTGRNSGSTSLPKSRSAASAGACQASTSTTSRQKPRAVATKKKTSAASARRATRRKPRETASVTNDQCAVAAGECAVAGP